MATPVPAGTSVASLTAAGTLQFADRYGYVQVTNPGTSVIYASADPNNTAPTTSNDGIPVPAGGTVLLANQNLPWFQSSKVIPAGSSVIPLGANNNAASSSTVLSTPGNPGLTQPYGASGVGQAANPGTTVSVSGAATVAAAG